MRAMNADQALDELYASPLDAFTKTRDALARRLNDEGNAAASDEVKSARKPTLVAYVLNQLARRHPDDVAALVDVGRDLARAQRKALRGTNAAADLREAIARQREIVRALTKKTAALMQDLDVAPSGHLDEVAGALQAALVDPVVGARLEEGRLERVPAPAAGFPGAAPVPERETKREKQEAKVDDTRRQALAKARAAADDAQARATELATEAAQAARTAKELRADAERLAAEAHARAKEADRAESAAKKAQAAAKHAAKTAAGLATRIRAA